MHPPLDPDREISISGEYEKTRCLQLSPSCLFLNLGKHFFRRMVSNAQYRPMQQHLPKNLSTIWNDVKDYLRIRMELLKLLALEKAFKLMADLVTNTLVLLSLLMAFLASAITLAFYLSYLLNSYTKGFGCATIFFTLVACLILWKKSVVEKLIAGIAIKRYFEKHCEAQEEEEKSGATAEQEPASDPDQEKPWQTYAAEQTDTRKHES